MSKTRDIYSCTACGARSSQWRGQCPTCGEWNSLEAQRLRTGGTSRPLTLRAEPVLPLAQAPETAGAVFSTG
ncbi:MAG: DNA repair protein RadA, partial [Desulfovibrio sp.]|nr:DNA repair protein RadA [Desulfovibrio sp.]